MSVGLLVSADTIPRIDREEMDVLRSHVKRWSLCCGAKLYCGASIPGSQLRQQPQEWLRWSSSQIPTVGSSPLTEFSRAVQTTSLKANGESPNAESLSESKCCSPSPSVLPRNDRPHGPYQARGLLLQYHSLSLPQTVYCRARPRRRPF